MSELLENLATCLSAAAEPSIRLRAYVEEIDRYLDLPQLQEIPVDTATSHEGDDPAHQDFDPEIFVPFELLQRIPWDWAEQLQIV